MTSPTKDGILRHLDKILKSKRSKLAHLEGEAQSGHAKALRHVQEIGDLVEEIVAISAQKRKWEAEWYG